MSSVRKLTDVERAWVRLMENPYASLALLDSDDEGALPDSKVTAEAEPSKPSPQVTSE